MLKDVLSQVVETKLASKSEAELKQEYANTACRIGNLEYQIRTFKKELELLYDQMTDLNLSFSQLDLSKKEEPKNV